MNIGTVGNMIGKNQFGGNSVAAKSAVAFNGTADAQAADTCNITTGGCAEPKHIPEEALSLGKSVFNFVLTKGLELIRTILAFGFVYPLSFLFPDLEKAPVETTAA